MGVHGLWRLIEPSGKPVPLETLENKTLAVDVSIWLHQAVKGFQDSKGASLPNAHLLGIFHRVCKLLYFRIKPVFVFDGGVPVLKKQTIAKRNQQKSKNTHDANRLQKQLISTLLKHSAVNKVIKDQIKSNIEDGQNKSSKDMYALPPLQLDDPESSDEEYSSSDTTESSSPTKTWDLHTIDVNSTNFKSLPAEVRHEILTELKEMRKQNSWGRIHELPTQSDDFSGYQMQRLLKRFSVQTGLEEAEKEMGGASLSLGELESLLNDQGVVTADDKSKRIASDENRRYVFIRDLKQALENAKNQEAIEEASEPEGSNTEMSVDVQEKQAKTIADLEYEADLEKAIQLSLQDAPSTSNTEHNPKDNFSVLKDFDSDSSLSEEETPTEKLLTSAKNYMTEYSGLTPTEILKIITGNSKNTKIKKTEAKNAVLISKSKEIQEPVVSTSDSDCQTKTNALDKSPKAGTTSSEPSSAEEQGMQESVISTGDSKPKMTDEQTKREFVTNNFDNKSQIETKEKLEVTESVDTVELMSDSDSSNDFVDVDENETKSPKTEENKFEIVIDRDMKVEDDDLFSDIFTSTVKSEESAKEIVVNKTLSPEKIPKSPDELELPTTETNDKPADDKLEKNRLLDEVLQSANVDTSTGISTEQLKTIESNLIQEKEDLLARQSLKERLATNITDQMYQEAQELLQLFGIPYVVAPMEAEAQCAFLDEMNLTDGTITDDSDIWLFGGKTVYKNFFNQSKRVMEFRAENIQHSFKLTRYEMILLALLVGSDYTTGVQGVGPVTALEILANFPPKRENELILSQEQLVSGLRDFRRWISGERTGLPARSTLRNKLKNVSLADHFPSLQVVQAYLEPAVETSDEQFTWGKPDLVSLVDFAKEKFGWKREKSEEILKPVLKRLNETDVQLKITNFYERKHKIADIPEEKMSKRVKKALDKIGQPELSSEDENPKAKAKSLKTVEKKAKPKAIKEKPSLKQKLEKATSSKRQTPKETSEKQFKIPPKPTPKPSTSTDISTIIDEEIKLLQQTKKLSRKRVKQIENELRYELENPSPSTSKDPTTLMSRQLHTKEVIPQKLKDKSDVLKNKLKAIEVFRKSKSGPGYVPKRQRKKMEVKDDANLSEDSDS